MTYKTMFINDSDRVVNIPSHQGGVSELITLTIPASSRYELESEDPYFYYAPFSEIVWNYKHEVSLINRKKLKKLKYDFPTVVFHLLHGTEIQSFNVDDPGVGPDGRKIHVAKGIPLTVTVHPSCIYAVFERVETEFIPLSRYPIESVVFDGNPGIIKPRLAIIKRVNRRSGEDIEKLKEMRLAAKEALGKEII